MTLAELDEHEKLAFAGLLRLLVRVDGRFSTSEVAAITGLAKEMGSGEFWTLMREAQVEMATTDALRAAVGRVQRAEVREWIHSVLVGIAVADGIDETEDELLHWLSSAWNL